MKLTPDSPEITAYALGEVNAEEHAVIERAIAGSPELRAEIASLRRLADTLETQLAAEASPALDESRREAILEAAADPAKAVLPAAAAGAGGPLHWFSRLWTGITQPAIGFSLAAATALAIALALWTPWKVRKDPTVSDETRSVTNRPASQSGPGPGDPSPAKFKAAPTAPDTSVVPRTPAPGPAHRAQAVDGKKESALGGVAGGSGALDSLAAAPARSEVALKRDNAGFSAGPPVMAPAVASSAAAGSSGKVDSSTVGGLAGGSLGRPVHNRPVDAARRPVEALERRAPSDPAASSSPRPEVAGRELAREVKSLAEVPEARLGLVVGESLAKAPAPAGELFGYVPPHQAARPLGTESYTPIAENPFRDVSAAPLSTFGMDTDTASYANARRFLREGSLPPRDAVRLEELVNYFPYDYAAPRGPEPFAAHVEVADCPWNPGHRLVRIGLKAREGDRRERPRANLVFLVDVSGSMQPENKLPLVQRSLRLLLDQLDPRDSVGVVTYAGEAKVALEPTRVSEKPAIQKAIDALRAGSGTDGGSGIQRAYAMATNRFIRGGINRVILCTDGDFNVGLTSRDELLDLITEKAKSGVFLSVLGYGMDNYKDDTAELLADRGNGNYAYVDSFSEARKVLKEEVQGTLQTVAKDAKIQVEFNPSRVASWRLLGYENRLLADRDFNDDKKDAGEVGAGHAVTALYEIVPVAGRRPGVDPLRYSPPAAAATKAEAPHGDELLNLKVRYKDPEGDTSRLMQVPVKDPGHDAAAATADYKFAAAVVGYGLMLRDSPQKGDLTWDKVLGLAEEGLGPDREGYRAEFIDLVRRAKQLGGR
jgi:Ca-activated chloride channel homolog